MAELFKPSLALAFILVCIPLVKVQLDSQKEASRILITQCIGTVGIVMIALKVIRIWYR